MVLVFFVYGLAFFSMGFAIALESRQSSGLRLAASLPFLAAFGIIHSLSEWADMLLLIESAAPPTFDMDAVRLLRTLMLGASTVALLQFGAELLRRTEHSAPITQHSVLSPLGRIFARRWITFLPAALGLVWVATLVLLATVYPVGSRQWLIHGDVWARYLLYLPGSLLVGFALMQEAGWLDRTDFHTVGRDARFAAATFLLNAVVAGLVVPPEQSIPELPLNYDLFQAIFGIPVQILRAASALAIAFFILRVLRVFRIQSARQMELANQHRIQAQQEALEAQGRVQAEMERWNRELEDRIQQRTAEISLRNKQLLAVDSIAASISQSFDLHEILTETLDRTLEALDADGGGIFLSDRPDGEPTTQLTRGLPEDFVRTVSRTRLNSVLLGQLAHPEEAGTRPGLRTEDSGLSGPEHSALSTQHSALAESSVLSPQSFITAPLKVKGHAVGAITVARTREAMFGTEDGRLLTAIGHQVGIAVENARLFAQVQNMAALEERERLAREMHDGLAQVIGFLSIKTRVVRQMVADGRLQQAEADLDQMQRTVQDAYSDVRQSILSLRTATELDQGLLAAIRASASDFTEQNSIPVELALAEEGEVSFSAEAEVQLVRIVQEALANVRKHARANKVWIRLERRDGEILLSVEDDGAGFDPGQVAAKRRRCFGLETMRERAESIGARLDVTSVPGEGTRIQVRYAPERRATEPNRASESPAG